MAGDEARASRRRSVDEAPAACRSKTGSGPCRPHAARSRRSAHSAAPSSGLLLPADGASAQRPPGPGLDPLRWRSLAARSMRRRPLLALLALTGCATAYQAVGRPAGFRGLGRPSASWSSATFNGTLHLAQRGAVRRSSSLSSRWSAASPTFRIADGQTDEQVTRSGVHPEPVAFARRASRAPSTPSRCSPRKRRASSNRRAYRSCRRGSTSSRTPRRRCGSASWASSRQPTADEPLERGPRLQAERRVELAEPAANGGEVGVGMTVEHAARILQVARDARRRASGSAGLRRRQTAPRSSDGHGDRARDGGRARSPRPRTRCRRGCRSPRPRRAARRLSATNGSGSTSGVSPSRARRQHHRAGTATRRASGRCRG